MRTVHVGVGHDDHTVVAQVLSRMGRQPAMGQR